MEQEFCKCMRTSSIYDEIDDWGHWDMCVDCNKPIEGTYEFFNHYDGEDHCNDY
ncbi:hypothetical protein [Clostridium tagluense]|uniref:hypothetical protein n=1 Tax=Clostridium tagluense TaxID=360422 RepID=UPI001C6E7A11|nr:hypothetical protein [Clostridium tagluense]MBW9159460.1 hypothetical protein [Clostridium tagluense]WLC68468.1 hypothetical protein KTC93_25480 [Clostridium tagluense]